MNQLGGRSHERPPHVDFGNEQERQGTNFDRQLSFSSTFQSSFIANKNKPNLRNLSSIQIGPNSGPFVQWLRMEVSATSTMLFCICRNISSTKTSSSNNSDLQISSRVDRFT